MKSIYVLGSGGFAKEVFFLIQSIGYFKIEGFLDIEEKAPINIGSISVPVFSESLLSDKEGQAALALGVGSPALLTKLSSKYSGFEFPNLIHPNVIGNFQDIEMGKGNIITANCVFTTSIKIGSYNIFNLSTTVGHDVVIGNCNVINPAVNISGGVTIGDQCLIGVNATVLQYKKIGNSATVGASSLVNKDVEEGVTVIGIPAKPLSR